MSLCRRPWGWFLISILHLCALRFKGKWKVTAEDPPSAAFNVIVKWSELLITSFTLIFASCWRLGSVGNNISKMLQLYTTGFEYMVESDCYVRTQIGTVRHHKSREDLSCARLVQRSPAPSSIHSWTCPKNTSTPTWKPSSLTSAPIDRPTWVRSPKVNCQWSWRALLFHSPAWGDVLRWLFTLLPVSVTSKETKHAIFITATSQRDTIDTLPRLCKLGN